MLKRNASIKNAPERFQKKIKTGNKFDIVFTFDERVFNTVIEYLQYSSSSFGDEKPCHIINLSVKDNAEEAEKGSKNCLKFFKKILENKDDWENKITEIIKKFEEQINERILHLILYV
jgi:transcription termination factor NusB